MIQTKYKCGLLWSADVTSTNAGLKLPTQLHVRTLPSTLVIQWNCHGTFGEIVKDLVAEQPFAVFGYLYVIILATGRIMLSS